MAVLGGELAEQIGARLLERPAHQLPELVLNGGVAVAAEVAGDELAELLGVRVERLGHRPRVLAEEAFELILHVLGDRTRLVGERPLDLARELLELALDEVDLGAGGLAIEHARADLERVANGVLAPDALLGPPLDELG